MNTIQAYKVKQVAALLGAHVTWVKTAIRSGQLKAFAIGNSYRVTHAALQEFEETRHAQLLKQAETKTGMYARLGMYRKKNVLV